MKKIIHIIITLAVICISKNDVSAQIDSVIYVPVHKYEFGNTAFGEEENKNYIIEDRLKTISTEKLLKKSQNNIKNNLQASLYSNMTLYEDTVYAVGEISHQESTTPTGGLVYNVPITVSPLVNFADPISLQYNSQAGNGVAGYGWNICGLSSINITNKSLYYHGTVSPASLDDTNAAYTIDGVPLLQNDDRALSSEYELKSIQGHILVKKHIKGNFISHFTVKFPDGSSATYGCPDNEYAKIAYPITEKIDVNGNRIVYQYISTESENFISDIFYLREDGDTGESYIGRILFEYENRIDHHTRYVAGKSIHDDKILKRIVSESTYLNVLYMYTLTHEIRNGVNHLVSIGCANSENIPLKPLRFNYGSDSESNIIKDFEKQGDSFISDFFANDSTEIIYERGKFGIDNYYDGVVMYPLLNNYGIIDIKNGNRLFGSRYSPDQKIILAPRLNQSGFISSTITADEGFQNISVVDIDGDGTDEVIKVNFIGTSNDQTQLGITIYTYNSSTYNFNIRRVFNVNVNGVFKDGTLISPSQRCYHYGDFRGDGKKQLVTISYNTDPNTNLTTSYTSVIDLDTGEELSEENLFSLPKDDYVVCLDIDSDGRTELCRYKYPGFDVYNLSGNSFVLSRFMNTPSNVDFYAKWYYTDINGDGYIDIVTSSRGIGETWSIYINTGKSFVEEEITLVANNQEDADFQFIDVNKDGLPDFIHRIGQSLNIYINENGTFNKENKIISTIRLPENSRVIPYNISQHNTQSDFITVGLFVVNAYKFSEDLSKDRLLTGFTNSFGAYTMNTYENMEFRTDAYLTDTTRHYASTEGYYKRRFPLQLLCDTETYISDQISNKLISKRHYTYYDACIHNKGLGFCGFGKIRTIDFSGLSDFELTCTEVRDPENKGVTIRVEKSHRMSQDNPFEITEYFYNNNNWNPKLTKTIQKDLLKDFSTATFYEYDKYDFPKTIKTTHNEGLSLILEEKQTIEYEHITDTTNYLLGNVISNTLSKINYPGFNIVADIYPDIEPLNNTTDIEEYSLNTASILPIDPMDPVDPVNPGDPIKPVDPLDPVEPIDTNLIVDKPLVTDSAIVYLTRKQVYTYNEKMQPLSKVDFIGTSSSSLKKIEEVRWTYDRYGNKLSEMSAPYNVTTFKGKCNTYNGDGTYLESSTNEIGQTTTYSDYNKFGKPRFITDYAGRRTTYEYDDWGQIISETKPDGTITNIIKEWGGIGVFTQTKHITGKPSQIIHYDATGRELRRGSQRFDGSWIFTDTEYNVAGQIDRVSLPFKNTNSALFWNNYTYDEYQRPVSYTQASGNITTWSYDGNITTESKNGRWSIKTTNCLGQTTEIQDAGGTIENIFRADGQPLRTHVSNGSIVQFKYDEYGRRIEINDPSAGIQTDTTVFNNDGSTISTHKNPNGTIVTYKDAVGKVIKIERPGEYTTDYTYDSNGLLISEISSNGTSKSYQYDIYDRVVSITETIPDGKWLKKTYTYCEGNNISTITYESQDGVIATEYYEYSNGTNVKIELESTNILNINAENEFGQPTSVTTGNVTRTYSYDAYGMPVRRTMGTVMDCSYSFNHLNGNLISRTDNTRNQSESFGYDELNRLTAINDRIISYSDNGNITRIDDVGELSYDNSLKPYQVTSLALEEDVIPSRVQSVSYTCYSRPSIMTEGGRCAAYTYNGEGERVKMNVSDGAASVLSRYYIGNQYELDVTPTETTERLYLGGDAYSAPAVYIKEESGAWTFYNIGRDYLGNITHIATADGTLVEENSYDPWGRLRNPETKEIYSLGTEPELMLGRGYTGHEHLTWFGLINMNARLYDPVLGRFLSPDPFVQMPDFTQNFNRYSYCLNNPFVYVDENGELWSVITAIFRLPDTIIRGVVIPFFVRFSDTRKAGQMASSAWQEYGQTVANAAKIDYGIIYTDKNKSAGGRIWEFFSRFLWQPKQFALGYLASGLYNLSGGVKSVSLYGGATVSESYASGWGDISLGNYIIGQKGIYADPANPDFQHEYGHYIQSQRSGYAYFPRYGVPSLFSKSPHDYHPVEQDANIRAFNYFSKHVSGFNSVDAYGNYNGMWDLGYSPILGLKPTDTTVLDKRLKWSFWDLLAGFVPIVGDFAGGGIRSHYDRKKY